MYSSFRLSFRIGLSPDIFWQLTPFQFSLCVQEYYEVLKETYNRQTWLMWHGAAIPRMKNFPDLQKFIIPEKITKQKIDENAIMARMRAYKERYKKEVLDGAVSS